MKIKKFKSKLELRKNHITKIESQKQQKGGVISVTASEKISIFDRNCGMTGKDLIISNKVLYLTMDL